MSGNDEECLCKAGPKLIFACSGASDVGALSDQAARTLSREGAGKMFCLAGIGGRVPGIVESTKAASLILAIDGCFLDCARRTLEEAGFGDFLHLQLRSLGMDKGKSPVTAERVTEVAEKGRSLLATAKERVS